MKVKSPASEGRSHRSVLPAKSIYLILLGTILLLVAGNAAAFEIKEWRFRTSLYTRHWDPEPEHDNSTALINFEFETSKKWFYGFAWFDNSFGQPSQYLYAGYSWKLFRKDWAYFSLSGGLLNGYDEPNENKIPLNGLGIAPAMIPTFGVKHKRVFAEVQILGNAAIVVTAGFSFGQKPADE